MKKRTFPLCVTILILFGCAEPRPSSKQLDDEFIRKTYKESARKMLERNGSPTNTPEIIEVRDIKCDEPSITKFVKDMSGSAKSIYWGTYYRCETTLILENGKEYKDVIKFTRHNSEPIKFDFMLYPD